MKEINTRAINGLPIKNALFRKEGGLRLWAYLALAAAMYLLSCAGVYALYWQGYQKLMAMWGVTAENVSRAPGMVRLLYQWSGALVTLLQNTALLGSAIALNRIDRRKPIRSMRGWGKGAAIGSAVVMTLWAALLISGSVRLGWRLTRPRLTAGTLAILPTAWMTAVGEGCFLYGAVYGALKQRCAPWVARLIALLSAMGFRALTGDIQALTLVNTALAALACCLLADQAGAAAVGFLFAREFLSGAALGFAGCEAALYETYPVNRYWLCGGHAGPENGLMLTLVLLALLGLMLRKQRSLRATCESKAGD